MAKTRTTVKRLTSTYVTRKPSGKYGARAINNRTGDEGRSTGDEISEAARLAKEKISEQ